MTLPRPPARRRFLRPRSPAAPRSNFPHSLLSVPDDAFAERKTIPATLQPLYTI